MADDPTQRPFRSNEPPARGAPGRTSPSGSDPLAELARLIGQNDPFAEFGRPAAPPMAAPDVYAAEPPLPPPPRQASPSYTAPSFGRQPYSAPPAGDADLYHLDQQAPVAHPPSVAPSYHDDTYHPSNPQLAPEDQDFYDDVQPSRRRMGVLVIAGVFALAVIGTAGAFGYRALFGSSGASAPPPVIKAETAPSKIVPAATKDSQTAKQITDRINDRGMGEKLVSREEQPVDIKNKPAGVVFPPGQGPSPSSSAPALGSGVVGSEPKRVRTIAIHPDQAASADAPPLARAAATPQARPAPPPRVAASAPPRAADPEPAAPAPRPAPAPAAHQAAPPASSNAPLSLNPDTPVRSTRRAAAPAAAPAPAANGNAGGYAVQVSSQRSEAEAQSAFRSLQGKYPAQLGGKQPLIHRVDLGAKGIYFRAMVGPFADAHQAGELCTSLKAAGGQCIVQRN